MLINQIRGEINLKIVYYGPACSGKTTNLEVVYQRTPKQHRTEMISLKTRGDRTLFFDYMQLELNPIYGLKPKFNLYTVPGQVEYTVTRKLVLQGADAVIFVVDSQTHRMNENIQALIDMHRQLKENGLNANQVVITVQFNKRDLPNAMPVANLSQALGLNKYPSIPCFEASAVNGKGVFETLKTCIGRVVSRIEKARV